jgi:hypothetical protein
MTAHPDLVNLLSTLEAAAIRLWPEAGHIHYRAPGPIPRELRQAIAANKTALIALLGIWDTQETARLQILADGEVEEHGGRGDYPGIQEYAQQYVEALHWRDMAGVRAACAKVEARARALAATHAANAKQAA